MLKQLFMNKLKLFIRNVEIRVKKISGKSMKYFFPFIIMQVILFSKVYSQTISISGKISSNRIPIQNASVTFIDQADTSSKISTLTDNSGQYQVDLETSAISESNSIPEEFELAQNYPNPFSSSTAIPYKLNKRSDITITIYDVLGRKVRKFTIGTQRVGEYNVIWDGRDQLGTRAAKGVYFYKIQSHGESLVKKMIFEPNGNNSIIIPNLHSQTFNSSFNKINKTGITEGNVFTIRVENTSTTSPLLIPQEIENITIQNDTTINFSVTYIPLATFNFDSLHQIIRGYGAASPWYLPVATDGQIQKAFGTDDGQIGLSIYRITLESNSDLWAKWVPSTKKAYEMGAIIIAAPWYAPNDMVETINGVSQVKYDKYAEYAAHLDSFNTYMTNNGVPIYGISIQNEPEAESWTHWTPVEMLKFVKENAHTIEGTKVMAPESWGFNRNYSDPILNDSVACANTDIVCGHIYGGGLYKYPLAEEKGKEVWMTEYLMGENNSGNNMYWAIELAKNINDVMKADMNAYVWWTMVRYYGPIGDGLTATSPEDPRERYPAKGEVTKKGYVLSQFSKFIRPGFYRVESAVAPVLSDFDVTAYKDPSSSKMVIVAINSGDAETENAFRIENDIIISTFTPYTTSETKKCKQEDPVDVIDGCFYYTLEPSSITTFISD